jgi:isopenicillin N synthase-like dioxygenase
MMQAGRIPVIDVARLLAGGPQGAAAVAAEVGRACRDIGFFYVGNHGIPESLIADVFSQARQFFAAPAALKEAVRYTGTSGNRGHVPLEGETLDPSTQPDLKECFNIGLELGEHDPELRAGRPFRHRNPWPALPGFRQTMLAYFDGALTLGRSLHRAFALDLGVEAGFFEDKLDRPMAILRLLHYPGAAARDTGRLGAGEHSDYGNLTLLATDDVGGLFVRARSGEWLEAPPIAGALLCNIGDCLMRWTNDTYVSTRHRVASPVGRDRYSVVFFFDPNPEAVVSCLPTCLHGGPPKYPPIAAADYLRARLEATYRQ